MKPITKLYLKIFLFAGVSYGFITLALSLIAGDKDEFNLWSLLITSFFFGIAMSLILVSVQKYRLKKNGVQEISDKNFGVSQTAYIKSDLNKSELINKLKTDPVIRKMTMIEIENGILLQTGMTWKSWGEEIKIILKTDQESDFEYEISSSPKLKTTLIDYGKNLENIDQVKRAIKRY